MQIVIANCLNPLIVKHALEDFAPVMFVAVIHLFIIQYIILFLLFRSQFAKLCCISFDQTKIAEILQEVVRLDTLLVEVFAKLSHRLHSQIQTLSHPKYAVILLIYSFRQDLEANVALLCYLFVYFVEE